MMTMPAHVSRPHVGLGMRPFLQLWGWNLQAPRLMTAQQPRADARHVRLATSGDMRHSQDDLASAPKLIKRETSSA